MQRTSDNCWGRLKGRVPLMALGQIGSVEAVDGLLDALADPYSEVCRCVAEALGQIGDAAVVANLWQLHLQQPEDYLEKAIAAIQNRCKFYNYEIWQEAVVIQKANREKPAATTQQMTNVFPNATEVKIFERVEHYHPASIPPPDASSQNDSHI